jgi:hypothetical protein
LLVIEHAQFEVRAFGFEFVELISQISKRIGAGCGGHGSLTNFFSADFAEERGWDTSNSLSPLSS